MSNLKLYYTSLDTIEAGIDEAGKGPLIGRVYVGCVVLDPSIELHPWLNDSKKVTSKRRKIVRNWVEENALAYSVQFADENEVDKYNILKTTLNTMHKCLKTLDIIPDKILVDGDKFNPYMSKFDDDNFIPHICIPGGDGIYASIAAASILAKEYHDDYINDLCDKYMDLDPKYDLRSNQGYGTKYHIAGIKEFGLSQFHRKSFCTKFGIII
jgi:ribonuclease HII